MLRKMTLVLVTLTLFRSYKFSEVLWLLLVPVGATCTILAYKYVSLDKQEILIGFGEFDLIFKVTGRLTVLNL